VPELESLRLSGSDGDTLKLTTTLKAAAGGKALHLLPFRSTQFEVVAKFAWATASAPTSVGVRIVGSDDTATPSEFALVGLNLTAPPSGLAIIDRRRAASGRPEAQKATGVTVAASSGMESTAPESDSAALSFTSPPPRDMGPDVGWDRPGSDFRCWNVPGSNEHGHNSENISSCAAACEHEPRCVAWSFVWNSTYDVAAPCSNGQPLHGRYCTLKDKLANITAVSGTTCGLPKRSAGWLRNHTQPPPTPPTPPTPPPKPPPPPPPVLAPDAGADIRAGPMPNGTTHQLHAFVDRSTVETFWDNRTTVSAHVWPAREDSDRVALYLECGSDRGSSNAAGAGAAAVSGCEVEVTIELWKLQGLF
jgi:hypothetical protein